MKNVMKWFGALPGWIKTIVVVLLLLVLVLVGLMVYKIFSNVTNGVKGITDWLGLTKSEAKKELEANIKKDTVSDAWKQDLYLSASPHSSLSYDQLINMAVDMHDCFGFISFNIDKAYSVVKRCHNKVDVSGLVHCYSVKYQKDLLSNLLPAFWGHPNDEQFKLIHDFVDNLPNE